MVIFVLSFGDSMANLLSTSLDSLLWSCALMSSFSKTRRALQRRSSTTSDSRSWSSCTSLVDKTHQLENPDDGDSEHFSGQPEKCCVGRTPSRALDNQST